jgi:nitroreductase
MDLYALMTTRRSIRRFSQEPIKVSVDAARLAPSAANLQPLDFVIVTDPPQCAEVFSTLRWAAYLSPPWTPAPKERPVAYVVVIVKEPASAYFQRDMGLACENIILLAEERGLGTCLLCNIDKERLKTILALPDPYVVDAVVACGYKAESPIVEETTKTVRYWRDEEDVLHVPKRPLSKVVHYERFGGTDTSR